MIRQVVRKVFEYRITNTPTKDWDLCWTDTGVSQEMVNKMKSYQKINHFPGMNCLSKKNHLERNLAKMAREFGSEYKFFPRTWVLPADWNNLKMKMSKGQNKTYIVKPHSLSQGNGIYLTKSMKGIEMNDHCVVQEYIASPYLIDGLKFDLRIYVLVYGCDPLRIYMFKEGIARFSTDRYTRPNKDNIDNRFMHLTNYAINKTNKKFTFGNDPTIGHKRSLASVWSHIDKHGGNSRMLIRSIQNIVVKTLCAVQSKLSRAFRACQPNDTSNSMCFEVLGFDILLEDNLKPWLLEVNHSPSFNIDTPFDKRLKTELLTDVITLLSLDPFNRLSYLEKEKEKKNSKTFIRTIRETIGKEEREELIKTNMMRRDTYELLNCRGFTRIYPNEQMNTKYQAFLDYANAEIDHFYGIRKRGLSSRSGLHTDLYFISNTSSTSRSKFTKTKYLMCGNDINKKLPYSFGMDRFNRITSIYAPKIIQEKSNKHSKANTKKSITELRIVLRPRTTMMKQEGPAL